MHHEGPCLTLFQPRWAERSPISATFPANYRVLLRTANSSASYRRRRYTQFADWLEPLCNRHTGIGCVQSSSPVIRPSAVAAHAAKRKTKSASHPWVLIGIVLPGTLMHAGFEDWLFAKVYYLTVLFWTFSFMLVNFLGVLEPDLGRTVRSCYLRPGVASVGAISASQ